MARENIEIVRALVPPPEVDLVSLFRDAELYEQAVTALEEIIDPGVQSVAMWQGADAPVHRGVDGFRQLWLDWLEPWATYHVHAERLVDAGDRVVVLIRDRARRDDAGPEVELISGSVWEVRDGRIVRVQFCRDQAQALEVAGL